MIRGFTLGELPDVYELSWFPFKWPFGLVNEKFEIQRDLTCIEILTYYMLHTIL